MQKLVFLFCSLPALIYGKVIEVFPNQNNASVLACFEAASPMDTIYFNEGLYFIHDITISKPLTVSGAKNAILDGSGKYEMLTISGTSVKIIGLTLRNAGYSSMNDYAAIKVIDAADVLIENNTITDAYFAIHLSNVSRSTIRNNLIRGLSLSEQLNGNAIHAWKCDQLLIENNTVSQHRDGIYLEFVTHSIIRLNVSSRQLRYGLHFMFSNDDEYSQNTFANNGAGVAVMYSRRVKMSENVFRDNWGASSYGLLLKDIVDSEITNNRFETNTKGIHMEGSNRIQVRNNSFKDNGWGLVIQASCMDNLFTYNNFINNSFDVATNGQVTLNRFENNYWDEYEGYDLDRNGVGDIPYHPLSLFSVMIEQNPAILILIKSFMMQMLERMEKAIPGLTPEHFVDLYPLMKAVGND
ncbi:MAG: nitrous oxide reductase family maturation protein NosD [Saprospiraceae bacterium]|nr:nitrous oxide reductase family maturation protein NosD [Saprospiraceae bacterium]